MRRLGNDSQHGRLRRLPQNAGRLAVLVAVNLPALRIAAGQGDAAQLQRPRIGHGDVPVDAHQKYRMSRRHFIQIPAGGRHLHRPQRFVPARTQNPVAGLRCFHFLLHHRSRSSSSDFTPVKSTLSFVRSGIVEMQVRVVEAGHYEMSAEVDHLRLRPFQLLDVESLAHGLNAIATHRNRFFAQHRTERSICGHAGIDVGVHKNDVGPRAGIGWRCRHHVWASLGRSWSLPRLR